MTNLIWEKPRWEMIDFKVNRKKTTGVHSKFQKSLATEGQKSLALQNSYQKQDSYPDASCLSDSSSYVEAINIHHVLTLAVAQLKGDPMGDSSLIITTSSQLLLVLEPGSSAVN